MEQFNASRLDLARRRRGMTKRELAEAADLTPRTLTLYERGDRWPTETTVARLASALRFPVAFFAGDDIDEPSVDGVSFRALKRMTSRQRDQARSAAGLALQLNEFLDRHFDLPAPDLPDLSGDPEAAAHALRVRWGLGMRRAPNLVHLLELHGVRVFSLAEENQEVDAFSFWHGDTPFVFLNTRKSAERSRMDAAHELGHLVMHRADPRQGRVAEYEAQSFGAAFLMPAETVLAEAPRGARIDQLVRAKRRWNVSVVNLAYRMQRVGMLTEWEARRTFVALSQAGYRSKEPDPIPRERSQVLDKAFGALRLEGRTPAGVARELAVPVEELNKLIFGLIMVSTGPGAEGPTGCPPDPPARRFELIDGGAA